MVGRWWKCSGDVTVGKQSCSVLFSPGSVLEGCCNLTSLGGEDGWRIGWVLWGRAAAKDAWSFSIFSGLMLEYCSRLISVGDQTYWSWRSCFEHVAAEKGCTEPFRSVRFSAERMLWTGKSWKPGWVEGW